MMTIHARHRVATPIALAAVLFAAACGKGNAANTAKGSADVIVGPEAITVVKPTTERARS